MNELIKSRVALRSKNGKKGFTLIEVIVVLVILAILAAIAVPALTGYIDKANQRASISQAAVVRTSLQAIASDSYQTGGGDPLTNTYTGTTTLNTAGTASATNITGYSPISGSSATIGSEVRALTGTSVPAADADLTDVKYSNRTLTEFKIVIGNHTVTFANGNYTVS